MTEVRLHHVHPEDWSAVRSLEMPDEEKLALLADLCRIDCLYMVRRAGSGHLGSSFSSLDIVAWVFREALLAGAGPIPTYFSSKGHDAPGLYSLLIACGVLPAESIDQLRRLGGLPGHPDVRTPGMVANCGSLGMGISKAKGLIEAGRLRGQSEAVVVMTGDGELQEGQIWESLAGAANRRMSELRVVVDHNKIQSDTLVERVSDLGDLEAKFTAFGWNVRRCDGHSMRELRAAFAALDEAEGPGVVIADTVKGRGVSFMEGLAEGDDLYRFHSGAPSMEHYEAALGELCRRVSERLKGGPGLRLLESTVFLAAPPSPSADRLVDAYSLAIVELARSNDRVVALDGDLVLDTGLIPFAREFPERFIECGIAEQDMVSQAGGLALGGFLPVVHSFSCFLTTRPAEQIGTNASENTQIIYVGSLSGIVPGGPGHSHQSIRDAAMMASVPGMTVMEPSCADEVAPLLEHAAGQLVDGPSFLRLVTVPVDVPFMLSDGYVARRGRGWEIQSGSDLLVVGAGPVVLSQAVAAAGLVFDESGFRVSVYAMPWLNHVDPVWLAEVTQGHDTLVVVENHLTVGGLASSLAAAVSLHLPGIRVVPVGLSDFPACGTNDEVLRHHGLDADSLAAIFVARILDASA